MAWLRFCLTLFDFFLTFFDFFWLFLAFFLTLFATTSPLTNSKVKWCTSCDRSWCWRSNLWVIGLPLGTKLQKWLKNAKMAKAILKLNLNFFSYLSNSFIAAKLKNKKNPIKSLTWKTFLLHAEFEYTMCYLRKSFHAKINIICMTNVGALLWNTRMFWDQSCLMSNYIITSMQNISTAIPRS